MSPNEATTMAKSKTCWPLYTMKDKGQRGIVAFVFSWSYKGLFCILIWEQQSEHGDYCNLASCHEACKEILESRPGWAHNSCVQCLGSKVKLFCTIFTTWCSFCIPEPAAISTTPSSYQLWVVVGSNSRCCLPTPCISQPSQLLWQFVSSLSLELFMNNSPVNRVSWPSVSPKNLSFYLGLQHPYQVDCSHRTQHMSMIEKQRSSFAFRDHLSSSNWPWVPLWVAHNCFGSFEKVHWFWSALTLPITDLESLSHFSLPKGKLWEMYYYHAYCPSQSTHIKLLCLVWCTEDDIGHSNGLKPLFFTNTIYPVFGIDIWTYETDITLGTYLYVKGRRFCDLTMCRFIVQTKTVKMCSRLRSSHCFKCYYRSQVPLSCIFMVRAGEHMIKPEDKTEWFQTLVWTNPNGGVTFGILTSAGCCCLHCPSLTLKDWWVPW